MSDPWGIVAAAQKMSDAVQASISQPPDGGGGTPPSFDLSKTPFAATSSWNKKIPSGKTYKNLAWPASTGWNYSVTWNHASPPIYVASASDPMVSVSCPASWGWPANPSLRIPKGATGGGPSETEGAGADLPFLVIDDTGMCWNFWRFRRTSDTTATAEAMGRSHIATGTGWGDPQGAPGGLGAGITAAGSSQLAGLLVQAHSDAGAIQHAIALALDTTLLAPGYVAPAIGGDGRTSGAPVKEGMLLAIPPTTTKPSNLSPLGGKVYDAFRDYGAFVIDNGTDQTAIRAQANAYDSGVMGALKTDLQTITRLLKIVA